MELSLKHSINEWKTSRGLSPYAEKTINKYIRDIKWLAPNDYKDMEWAKNTKEISDKLSHFKPNTQRNYYNSLLIGLYASGFKKGQGVSKIYEAKRDMLNANYENQGGKTDKQQIILKEIDKESIEGMLNIMKKDLKTRHTHMLYVMISIYKHFAFRNDVAGMEIFPSHLFDEILYDERATTNYLVLGKPPESMSFILNDYKTSNKYGEKNLEIKSKELQNIISTWIKFKIGKRKDSNKEIINKVVYLFDWATGNPLSRNDVSHALSDTFNKYLGHSVSTTLLRKIYSTTITDPNTATDEEIQEVIDQADASGHSVKTKTKIYHK